MTESDISKFAKVRPTGSIVIDDKIRCDGDDFAGLDSHIDIACFTHIHDDHIRALPDSVAQCSNVLMTKLTKELANAIFGEDDSSWLDIRRNVFGLETGEKNGKKIDNYTISFIKNNHILGSGQLLVRSPEFSTLYSSDFTVPGTNIVQDVDYLILDSTHGAFSRSQKFESPSVSHKLIVDKAKEILEIKKQPLIIRAHRGTLQKVMSWLRSEIDEQIPFFSNDTERKIANVYGRHGFECGDVKEEEGWEAYYKKNHPFVRFLPISTSLLECETVNPAVASIRVGSSTSTSLDKLTNMFVVNLQEHATIDEVLEYVNQVNPKNIIIDNSLRISNPKHPETLYQEIKKERTVYLSPESHPKILNQNM